MSRNKLIIAAAGSGKTDTIVKEALAITDKNILITTFTEANEAEIKRRILRKNKGCMPSNLTVQTWFSFLLQHGVRPYQDIMFDELSERKIGFYLVEWTSTVRRWKKGETYYVSESRNFYQYYFSSQQGLMMHSDKVAEFACKCNAKISGSIFDRIARVYPYIFIDEVQDLAWWDLEVLKLLFDSPSDILLVGDPRQATYSTNNSRKNSKFKQSEIVSFFNHEDILSKLEIDPNSLKENHRCNQKICDFSNKLFPTLDQTISAQHLTTNHDGIFLIKKDHINHYLWEYADLVQLRYDIRTKGINTNYRVMNFWASKGLTFDRVLIFPTESITEWMKNNQNGLQATIRSKLYVALTRARHSVAIVYDYKDSDLVEGTEKYIPAINEPTEPVI